MNPIPTYKTNHETPTVIFGRNIRPGMTPGGFIGDPGSRGLGKNRPVKSSSGICAVATRWLEARRMQTGR